MQFISTRNSKNRVPLKEVVLKGLADDGGLFMPEEIPEFSAQWWNTLSSKSDHRIATDLLYPYLEDEFSENQVFEIAEESLNFSLPVKSLDEQTHILELFHGPTLAFKDVGARFLASVMERLLQRDKQNITILTATSGDTGSAVAQAFYGSKHIKVMVLYPKDRVSEVQEKQIATLGNNITALEVNGSFDDCQRMVKEAFSNRELRKRHRLTSANSINLLRLLPQMIYYVLSWQELQEKTGSFKPVFSVPSGNFGNLTAGLIAWKMGMPAHRFLAACNANHVFPNFLQTGNYTPHPSKTTLSNAMDVGDPSNFERMKYLFGDNIEAYRTILWSRSYTNDATLQSISGTYKTYGYLADPHTAVGLNAWRDYITEDPNQTGIVLSTAHPSKFGDSVKQATGIEPDIPDRLAKHLDAKKLSVSITNNTESLITFLDQE